MLRMMMAGLALAIATPAAAQKSELPLWAIGTWCFERDTTKVCIRYDPPDKDGVILATNVRFDDGRRTEGNTSTTSIEDGVLVKRGSNGSVLREVSHGPAEVVMDVENPEPDQARRIRYSIEGDEMIVEFTLPDGRIAVQRYRRER